MTTLPDEAQARELAKTLVTDKLAACINILPKMSSIYEWQGKLEQGEEHLLLIKTEQHRVAELQNAIKQVPCFQGIGVEMDPNLPSFSADEGYLADIRHLFSI